jgi:formiminoglutamase
MSSHLNSQFRAVDNGLFFSRGDVLDPRLGDSVKALSNLKTPQHLLTEMVAKNQAYPGERAFVIAGYPDDEGIRLNGGRPGASQGPTEIRRALYRMTPALYQTRLAARLWDIGDLVCDLRPSGASEVLARHQTVSEYAQAALLGGTSWIGLGGGHDYGFADASAYCQWAKSEGFKPLVINFDAHLDVRPFNNTPSSGTPFFRMLENYPEAEFAEIGIQAHCNSRSHLEWVCARGARVLTQEEIEASSEPMVTVVTRFLGELLLRPRPVFLSIDVDGFSSAVAPGCSQSWATGFMPADFFPVLNLLSYRLDIRMLGIYEVSPALDSDLRTAKLAAQIVHRVIS